MNNFLSSAEIAEFAVNAGIKKANLSVMNQFILGILAGAFIAFGAQASNIAVHTITNVSIGKFIGGLIFPVGLMLVLMAGAELFTGNCLMIMALADKKITMIQLLRSWIIVYIGNLAGGILIAFLISWSGQLNYTGGLLGGFTIKAAAGKVTLSFCNALVLGILCNWVVCLAVWISFGAKDGISKIFCAFFPIWLFVASGFEHSIANMYYMPAGIIAKCNPLYVSKALESGVSQSAIDSLNWSSMFTNNLLPVTLGNIIGGSFFVGMVYWLAYMRGKKA